LQRSSLNLRQNLQQKSPSQRHFRSPSLCRSLRCRRMWRGQPVAVSGWSLAAALTLPARVFLGSSPPAFLPAMPMRRLLHRRPLRLRLSKPRSPH
jgi:hypothetical protein